MRRPPRSTQSRSSAASDVYKRQIQHIRDSEYRDNTCVILFAPYAATFGSDGRLAAVDVAEEAMRVPVICSAPGTPREDRAYPVSLEDIVPALSRLANLSLDDGVDGRSFLFGPVGKDPVSMMAEPFRLTVRSGNWRYVWEPGPAPFGEAPMPGAGQSTLYRVGTSTRKVPITAEHTQLVDEFQKRLAEYVHASYLWLSLIHISEPTRLLSISYAVFCLKTKNTPASRTYRSRCSSP